MEEMNLKQFELVRDSNRNILGRYTKFLLILSVFFAVVFFVSTTMADAEETGVIDNYSKSVSESYIQNNTYKNLTFTLYKSETDINLNISNITIELPQNFSFGPGNGTTLGYTNNWTRTNNSNIISWKNNSGDNVSFNATESFWVNVTTFDDLGASVFNIRIIGNYTGFGGSITPLDQNITFTIYTTTNFSYSGWIYNNTGTPIEGATAEISVSAMSDEGGMADLGTFVADSNATGGFNITGIPICQNYSNIGPSTGMGGGGQGLFYRIAAYEYNDSSHNYAINTSRVLPSLPASELKNFLGTPEFYLIPAISFNVTAEGRIYNPWPPTWGSKDFSLNVKDQDLGYSVKEFDTKASYHTFSVPKGRNYSFSIYPDNAYPMSIRFNNITGWCEDSIGNREWNIFGGKAGVNSSCMAYNGTYLVNITVNTTSSAKNLTGNFTGITGALDSMSIVAYTMETRDVVFESWALPYNIGYERNWTQYNDTYNLTEHNFSVALPATMANSYLMLRAYAYNASSGVYYMGTNFTNASNQNLNVTDMNFTMEPLINGTARSISARNVSDGWNETVVANTTAVTFRLINESGLHSPLSTLSVFVEITRERWDGTEYKTMIDGQNGMFNLSLVNGSSIKKLTIYTQQYAPISTPVSAEILNGTFTGSNMFFDATNNTGICNITMRQFGQFDPLNENNPIQMNMYLSNDSCNIPNPPQSYALFDADQGESEFSPLNAILKGDINMMITAGKATVYYINVDLLASGPPDAAFTDEGDEAEFSSLWKFGSQGPEIYDYVLIGVNYTGMPFENDDVISLDFPYLYDIEFNEIWNRSKGHGVTEINEWENLSDYTDYLNSPYEAYLNGTGVFCDPNDPTLSNGIAYNDVQNTTIWMKIPHFSGLGGELGGAQDVYVDDDADPSWYSSSNVSTIQEGVNNVTTNGTVHIWDGTYTENVFVNKSVTIVANSSVVLDGNGGNGLTITSNNTVVRNLTIENCNVSMSSGILIYNSSYTLTNITINSVTINNSQIGIYVYTEGITNSDIIDCNLSGVNVIGLYLIDTSYTNITNCNVNNSGNVAVYLYNSSNNNISGNYICGDTANGIYFFKSTANNISDNTFWDNGLVLAGTAGGGSSFAFDLSYYNHTVENNLVNGDPLRYYKNNHTGAVLDENDATGQIILVNCSNFDIRNMNLNNSINKPVHLAYSDNINVSNCNISSTSFGYGVYLVYSNYSNISSNNISNNSYGILLRYAYNNNITGSNRIFENTGGDNGIGIGLIGSDNNKITGSIQVFNNTNGIYLTQSSNNFILSNDIYNNSYGIKFLDSSSNNNISSSNYIYNNTNTGIDFSSSDNNNITSNYIYNNTNYDIQISNSNNSRITQNQIHDSNMGIRLYYSNISNVSSNTIYDNTGLGIKLFNAEQNTIYDNTIYGNQWQGVDLVNSNNSNNIISNDIYDNDQGIRFVSSDNNMIYNNNIYDLISIGIGLKLSSNNNISSNTVFRNNTNHCSLVRLNFSEANMMYNNNFYDSYYSAIWLDNSTNGNRIVSNHVNNSTDGHGVRFTNSNDNNITSNYIFNNSEDGIKLSRSSDGNNIISNHIYDNYNGLGLSDSQNNIVYNNNFTGNSNTNAYADADQGNTWNTAKTDGVNIVGGPYLGGNYWDDYGESDTDDDGLGNTIYTINTDNVDNLPLVTTGATTAPEEFTATAINRTVINLTWTKGTNADNTYIRYSDSDNLSDRDSGIGSINVTESYNDLPDLNFSTTYYFRAWSYNTTDNVYSPSYAEASATTDSNSAPSFSNIAPANNSPGESITPTLSIKVEDAHGDSMNVSFMSNVTGSWSKIGTNNNSVTNDTFTRVNDSMNEYNTKYWWSVNVSDEYNAWTNETYCFTTTDTVYVDDNFDSDTSGWEKTRFQNLTRAINNVSSNVTLKVDPGTYNENLTISKPYLTITANTSEKPVLDGLGLVGINVTANHTTIHHINITNCTRGIELFGTSLHNISLQRNKFFNCTNAIFSNASFTNTTITIQNNKFLGNNITMGMNFSNAQNEVNGSLNYWGSITGPYHSTSNENGTGVNVSDNVIFSPWIGINGGQITAGQINTTEVTSGQHSINASTNAGVANISIELTSTTNVTVAGYSTAPEGINGTVVTVGGILDLEIEDESAVNWPINLTMYYLESDLSTAGITEDYLDGMYRWNDTSESWEIYNDTGVNTTNVTVDETEYAGSCWANVYQGQLSPKAMANTNDAPNNPTGINPSDTATYVDAQPTVNITVSDADNNTLDVYFYENTSGSWVLQDTNLDASNNTSVTWNSYTNATDNMTTYYWSVNITDGKLWTNNTYSFTTEIIPSAPTGFTASEDGTSAIDLSWTKNSSADTTYIERDSSASWTRGSGTLVGSVTGESLEDSGLSAGTEYYYQAWSYNSGNNSYSILYASDSATTDSESGGPTGGPTDGPTDGEDTTEALEANLDNEEYSGNEDEPITFDASSSTGDITLYKWDWTSDGVFDQEETQATINHTYADPGNYNVTLQVTDGTNTSNDTATVTVNNVYEKPTITNIKTTPSEEITQNDNVTISADISADYEETITNVTLKYWNETSILQTKNMATSDDQTYSATIGKFSEGTTINYQIVAYDNQDNSTSETKTFTIETTETEGTDLGDLQVNETKNLTEQDLEGTGLEDVSVKSNKELKNITITIDKLTKLPTGVTNVSKDDISDETIDADEVMVYAFMDIKLESADETIQDGDVEITINFRIEQTWFDNHSISQDNIVLMRNKDGEWVKLETTVVKEEGRYVYFEAVTNGTSTFAITGYTTKEETTPSETEPSEGIPAIPIVIAVILIIILFIAFLFKSGYLYVEEVEEEKTKEKEKFKDYYKEESEDKKDKPKKEDKEKKAKNKKDKK